MLPTNRSHVGEKRGDAGVTAGQKRATREEKSVAVSARLPATYINLHDPLEKVLAPFPESR